MEPLPEGEREKGCFRPGHACGGGLPSPCSSIRSSVSTVLFLVLFCSSLTVRYISTLGSCSVCQGSGFAEAQAHASRVLMVLWGFRDFPGFPV